jgi:hypothetical protein
MRAGGPHIQSVSCDEFAALRKRYETTADFYEQAQADFLRDSEPNRLSISFMYIFLLFVQTK